MPKNLSIELLMPKTYHESEVGRDRVVIPAPPYLSQYALCNFIDIDGKQGLSNLSKNTKDRLLQLLFLSLLHTNKHTIGTHTHIYSMCIYTYINRCLKSQHS